MPRPIGEKVKYEKRASYPHLKPDEVEIWERFIEQYPAAFEEVQYDVMVGTPPPFDTTVNPETGADVTALYLKRIDAVGWKDGKPYIVEIKPRATTSALGQARAYARLYNRDVTPPQINGVIIVTDEILPDMALLAKEEGIILVQV